MLENLFKGKINCSENRLILPKMPIIATGIAPFDEVISKASDKKFFLDRCHQYKWTSQPWLAFRTKEIHPISIGKGAICVEQFYREEIMLAMESSSSMYVALNLIVSNCEKNSGARLQCKFKELMNVRIDVKM
ncbi:hypothetical protein BLOT_011748 [Blomia tropicalis]|nr:hypothetical protein BLOT_011748 [Blomia tropicalis]